MLILYFVANVVKNNNNRLVKTCVDYGVDVLNLDENNIKICNLLYKYRYLAYVICPNGYSYREWRDRTNIVLSINLFTTKSWNL